jgi:hypothetical protein
MKKLLAVLAVVALCFSIFTAQSFAESEDPFEIGKKLAMTGEYNELIECWIKETENSDSIFEVKYYPEGKLKGVHFDEFPKSGTGINRMCTKYFDGPKYEKGKMRIKDGHSAMMLAETFEESKESLKDIKNVTREEAEKEAWRILQYFGYIKK